MAFIRREAGAAIYASVNKHSFTVSLLALVIHTLVHPALAATEAQPDLVVEAAADPLTSDQQDYQVKTTRAGTKMLLTPRDVPQSVSVITKQRMQDQNLQSVGEVLDNTTGVATEIIDSERSAYFSRGFQISSFTFDDIPTSVSDTWNFGDAGSDTAIYDRIEVVRGATGLMTGAGSPGASINMVRKHADSKAFSGNVSASYGSWNKQRYVLDLSAPLNDAGSVRGRVIAGYQDQDSWLDRYHKSKKFLYGVVDADVTDHTTLSLGYDYQQSNTGNPTWGGLPTWYSNGDLTHYDRSTNSAANWTRYSIDSRKVFANATHNFDNGWSFRLNGTHAEETFNDKLLYVMDFPDAVSGEGTSGFGSKDRGTRKLDSIDTYASGPFDLFGRQHELVAGVSYSRQHNATYSADGSIDSEQMGSFNGNGDVAEPEWGDWYLNADDMVRQKSAYTAARFSLADPLSLILGARYTQWSTAGSSGNMRKNNLTPYGGLVYDINDSWSAYASYTSIFQPQTYRDSSGAYLSPVTGKNYETGLKSDWLNGRLTASFALFRIEQENVGQADGSKFVNNSSEQAYYAAKGAVSKGAEFELNGAVTENLQMTFGATRYVARDSSGRFNSNMPQTSFKLFSRYQLPMLRDLTIGGGVNWQNRTFQDATGPDGETQRVYQSSYPLANLFARYQATKQLAVQANVNNLFDRTYYSWLSDYAVYGESRNYSVNVSYQF
ncbi:outer membrane receptor for ferric coprogen and ferric-rhodotorulic acid [Erwinia toletana]|uniref:Outer membrane receptor for ferric coprogen and ferric-rhodotorulic acid n=1 Tax=Winslowiella toletana TaxID=92490 RepID=A0ABS4PD52_9GAMM|nr:ferric-rhodotorulic acid/ferric-coprogen receptor FhuE [Winslowiella toletana]MBP2169858.1 outer membrane receptor for ferric coprogen and ferric-rhodotorulic acid [Winslowiella toletana]